MVSRVAFDQILRLLLRGADRVTLERDGRGDFFLDRSLDVAGFRVPPHMIPNFEVLFHRHDLLWLIGGFRSGSNLCENHLEPL